MKMQRKSVLVLALFAVVGVVVAGDAAAQTPALKVKHYGPCRDPWINYAYMEKVGRNPIGAKNPSANHAKNDFGECNCNLYAGCAWNSYQQLETGVVSWNNYTRQGRVIVRQVGNAFQIFKGNSPATAVIRNAAGQMFDIMGKMLGGYSLMSANAQDLGNGTKVEIK
jgi:hypothetical protein